MSSLWTPDGERPVERPAPRPEEPDHEADPLRAAAAALGVDLDAMSAEDRAQLEAELHEMMQFRRQVAATPAAEMLTNYLMRFFDLVVIYLEAEPPSFGEAATVIEAFRSMLDGVGDRLGDHEHLLREALGQAQMLFVQVKNAASDVPPDA